MKRSIVVVLLVAVFTMVFVGGCSTAEKDSIEEFDLSAYHLPEDTAPRPYYFKVTAGSHEMPITLAELEAIGVVDTVISFEIERDGIYARGTLQYAPWEIYSMDIPLEKALAKGERVEPEMEMQEELSFLWLESEYGDCEIVMGDEAAELERIVGNISNHTALDVTRCANLRHICCAGLGYTIMDVTHNPKLGYLGVGDNNLTFVDLSQNPELRGHNAAGNPFTRVDFSHNPKLYKVYAKDCPDLTEADFLHNPDITDLTFENTPLRTLVVPWMEGAHVVAVGSEHKADGVDKLTVRRFPGSTATVSSANTEVTYVDDLKKP